MGESWIPGFRPGKAPRQIVTRKYSKEVNDQVKGEILLASLEQLAEEFDVAPLSPPDLNPNGLNIPRRGISFTNLTSRSVRTSTCLNTRG
jgi:trigger factor